MFTKALTLIALILALSACQLQAAVINSTWVGGEYGAWSTASNWNPPIVPNNSSSNTFEVQISNADIWLDYSVTIDILSCEGAVALDKTGNFVQLWIRNGFVNRCEFEIIDFDDFGYDDVTNYNYGKMSIEGADIIGNIINDSNAILIFENCCLEGSLFFQNKGNILINPLSSFDASASITNSGLIRLINSVLLIDEDPEDEFENVALINSKGGLISGSGFIYSENRIDNTGDIIATGILEIQTKGNLNNNGSLKNKPTSSLHFSQVQKAYNHSVITVNSDGGIVFDCNLVNEPNAVIKLLGGTLAATTITQKAGSTFQGFGAITGNVVIDPNAIIKLTGPTNIIGDVTIEEGATLDISDGTVLITGLTTCNGGIIKTFHGTIITQGGMSGVTCRRIFVD
jgi:hypothetical protein